MSINILNYHSVTDKGELELSVTIDEFKKQMNYFKAHGFLGISLEDYMDGKFSDASAVVLTFDDGYRDNYDNVLPMLDEMGFTATVYPVINFSESGIIPWHKHLTAGLALRWSEIQEMMEHGIRFGSHSMSHPDLTKIAHKEARREIRESKDYLEQRLGVEVRSFSYPHGRFNKAVRSMVQEAGYEMAVAQSHERWGKENLFSLFRLEISGRDNPGIFKFKLTPIYRLIIKLGFGQFLSLSRTWIHKLRDTFNE